jgi:hypothetical protein
MAYAASSSLRTRTAQSGLPPRPVRRHHPIATHGSPMTRHDVWCKYAEEIWRNMQQSTLTENISLRKHPNYEPMGTIYVFNNKYNNGSRFTLRSTIWQQRCLSGMYHFARNHYVYHYDTDTNELIKQESLDCLNVHIYIRDKFLLK